MTFKQKHVAVAIALLSMGFSHATSSAANIGGVTVFADQDRSIEIEVLYGASNLTFSNPGVNYSAYDNTRLDGAVGLFNTGRIQLTSDSGAQVQEQWKSLGSSGPGFESVFFPSKAAADADPLNEQYYQVGVIDPTIDTGSFRLDAAVATPVNSVSFDIVIPDSLGTINSTGRTILTSDRNAVATGGTMVIDNMTINLYNGTVAATVSGTRLAVAYGSNPQAQVDFAPQNITLWTFAGIAAGGADIAGFSQINVNDFKSSSYEQLTDPAFCGSTCYTLITDNSTGSPRYAVQTTTEISHLTMTYEGMAILNAIMGSNITGQAAVENVNNVADRWGSIQTDLILRQVGHLEDPPFVLPSIPEPSTYALMGLGLVGIRLVASRRKKQ